jgi:hypothetical protein
VHGSAVGDEATKTAANYYDDIITVVTPDNTAQIFDILIKKLKIIIGI